MHKPKSVTETNKILRDIEIQRDHPNNKNKKMTTV